LCSNVAANGQSDDVVAVDAGLLSAFDDAPTEEDEYA
jgi:hypothetical protein